VTDEGLETGVTFRGARPVRTHLKLTLVESGIDFVRSGIERYFLRRAIAARPQVRRAACVCRRAAADEGASVTRSIRRWCSRRSTPSASIRRSNPSTRLTRG